MRTLYYAFMAAGVKMEKEGAGKTDEQEGKGKGENCIKNQVSKFFLVINL